MPGEHDEDDEAIETVPNPEPGKEYVPLETLKRTREKARIYRTTLAEKEAAWTRERTEMEARLAAVTGSEQGLRTEFDGFRTQVEQERAQWEDERFTARMERVGVASPDVQRYVRMLWADVKPGEDGKMPDFAEWFGEASKTNDILQRATAPAANGRPAPRIDARTKPTQPTSVLTPQQIREIKGADRWKHVGKG